MEPPFTLPEAARELQTLFAAFSIHYARDALRCAGSMPEAAKLAGVTRQTLYRILAREGE